MTEKLTEKDLEQIFIASQYKKTNPLLTAGKYIGIFILVFVVVFAALNYSAYSKMIVFWFDDEFGTNKMPLSNIILDSGVTVRDEKNDLPDFEDNTIYIERIKVTAPIVFRVENNEGDVAQNLKKGTIHIAGTPLPGETGNVFITGHSSNYPWIISSYNSVFALLDREVVGDLILIRFSNTNYIYQIEDKFVVGATETSVMKNYADYPSLTLMTCYPVGTNLKRMIVRAKQIVPDPKTNRTSSASGSPSQLPQLAR